jgi:diguanylate cyclase (GGDEF)-like protein
MYDLSRDIVKPGCTLRELLKHRAERGHLRDDPDQYRVELLAKLTPRETTNSVVGTADGREISIASRPMPYGGWVVTHEDITERRKTEAKISHMALHDALTNLPNRLFFHEQIENRLAHLSRDQNFAVLCLDLDRFKTVNDSLGHPYGDKLLRQVAERMSGCLREGDSIARMGGDEFAIVQGSIKQPHDAIMLAARLCEIVNAPFDLDGHHVAVGVSIGIAIAPTDATDADQLLKNADMALYRAKADGRGTYRFFEPEMDALMRARRVLELDLRKALVNGEFELYYQPLVNIKQEEISGFEALIRWNHPERGLVAPLDFIPLAEETALIIPIGEWVLRQACAEAMKWPDHITIAVNLSPAQFKVRNLSQMVVSALAQSGLAAERLELEITESALLEDSDATLEILHRLRGLGVRISMDDFGTGYSSLSYLRSFPFDKIKIDRSFVHDLASNADSKAIIRAVTGLGTSLGITTTGEGVETQEELEYLKREGCTEAQGYFFSKPKPAGEVLKLLSKQGVIAKAVA